MAVEARCQKEIPINAEESSRRSNRKHKLFIGFLKILPMLMAGLYLLNTILSYFDIDLTIFSYLAGVGIIPWLFILVSSYLFHFCEYHRMFLWYIITNNIICWIDEDFGIPISDRSYFVLHVAIAGVFLFLVLYLHQRYRKNGL